MSENIYAKQAKNFIEIDQKLKKALMPAKRQTGASFLDYQVERERKKPKTIEEFLAESGKEERAFTPEGQPSYGTGGTMPGLTATQEQALKEGKLFSPATRGEALMGLLTGKMDIEGGPQEYTEWKPPGYTFPPYVGPQSGPFQNPIAEFLAGKRVDVKGVAEFGLDFLTDPLAFLLAPKAGWVAAKAAREAAKAAKPVARELALGQAGGVGKRVNKAAKAVTPQVPKVAPKEPWQMTRGDYLNSIKQTLVDSKTPLGDEQWAHILDTELMSHRGNVKLALSEGKPVPPEVLRDYPDLAKLAPVPGVQRVQPSSEVAGAALPQVKQPQVPLTNLQKTRQLSEAEQFQRDLRFNEGMINEAIKSKKPIPFVEYNGELKQAQVIEQGVRPEEFTNGVRIRVGGRETIIEGEGLVVPIKEQYMSRLSQVASDLNIAKHPPKGLNELSPETIAKLQADYDSLVANAKKAGIELVPEVPPVGQPPKPPAPPTSIIGATPPGKVIMGDLQNADELVTVMNQPDVYRKIANLPAVRQVMSYLNPSGIAKTVPEKGVVARAALREEGANKAIGAFSNLETVGRREKIWGQLDDAGRLTQGELRGKPLDEVLTYSTKYEKSMTPQQTAWARTFHDLETQKLNFLRRNGIEVNELAFEEGGQYVGRRVAGRINPLTNELDEAAFIGSPGPGRPGAHMGAEKTRYFKDINEAIEQGYRYLPPDEALFLNMRGAYNRIADKQMADWVLERIPWRTSASPETLILARDVARDKMATAIRLKSLLNRAVRGERVPLDESLVKNLPNETAELRSLIPELQKGGAVGDRVQSLTANLNDVVKTRKQEWREIADKLAISHEQALKTHLGEATVQAPAFSGKILTGNEAKQTAQTLNRAFSAQYGDLDKIISGVNKVNSIGRYFMLAGDASPMLIQLLTFTFRFPKIWGKSAVGFTKALFSPESQARYLAKNNDIIQKSRNLVLTKGGQTEFTEAFRSGGIMQSKYAKVPKAVLEPFQRGFEGALDTAGIELRKAFDHLATTPQRTAEVEQFINEIRGVTSSARIGVSPHLRAAETATTLAPRYNRAIAALVSDIARGGIRGDQARKALAALIGGGAAVATAISLARGEGWEGVLDHLNITKPSRFVTWDVGGQNVGPGSKIRSLLVLLGKIIDDPNRIVDHANDFMRGNFSPVLSTGFDILAGEDYIGEPTRPGKSGFGRNVPFGEGMLGLTKRVVADNLIPIWLQSVALEGGDLEQRAIRGTAEFFGGRAYPVSTSRLYSDKWEDDLKVKEYLATPSNDIELKAAQKTNRALVSREDYRIRHPDVEAKLFIMGQVDMVHKGALPATLKLIQENKIDPKTIDGVARNLAEKEKKTKLGVRDTTVTPTDRLVSSLMKIQGISKTESVQTPTQPSGNVPIKPSGTWEDIEAVITQPESLAFVKVWFDGQPLTPQEETMLKALFARYPLGQTNFNTWLRETTRQQFTNWANKQAQANKEAVVK